MVKKKGGRPRRIVHLECELKELHHGDGLRCGSLDVDKAFMELLPKLLGKELIKKFHKKLSHFFP